jgi:hypothetical protein
MISSAENVASSWELTQFIGGELKLIGLTRQVLHLNHESWDPKTMDYII